MDPLRENDFTEAGLRDENKTIGELMREMNMSKAATSGSKTNKNTASDIPNSIPKSALDVIKDTDINSKRKTKVKELKEKDSKKGKKKTKLEKQDFILLINSLRKLVNILRERDDKKLNILICESADSVIMQGANAVEKMLDGDSIDFTDFNTEIKKITSALEMIGSERRRAGLREDTENLAKTKLALDQIELGCHDVIIRTVKDGSSEIKTTMSSIGKLFNVAQAKKIHVAKLIADFDGFHRR